MTRPSAYTRPCSHCGFYPAISPDGGKCDECAARAVLGEACPECGRVPTDEPCPADWADDDEEGEE